MWQCVGIGKASDRLEGDCNIISSHFKTVWRKLQDGRGVGHGDHLPPHKYIRNTSTRRTAPKEHLLNAGRRPDFPKALIYHLS